MNIKKQIKEYMAGLEASEEGTLTASFNFGENFLGFQGHFPQEKVLPGVCHIQCITSMIEEYTGKPVLLKEIVSVKFLLPVFPSEEIVCTCRGIKNGQSDFVVRASVNRNGKAVSEIKLKGSFEQK
ncbi:MAG: hypothetical protein COS28_00130 [Nitrospirae bacterium CG02_land_8_20_14_3_00_44_33]|nr:MAG: hypothetical protein COS28_00130 [Nitrospirae bacterium CG02_land_8_20_14_3_00_44_33]